RSDRAATHSLLHATAAAELAFVEGPGHDSDPDRKRQLPRFQVRTGVFRPRPHRRADRRLDEVLEGKSPTTTDIRTFSHATPPHGEKDTAPDFPSGQGRTGVPSASHHASTSVHCSG